MMPKGNKIFLLEIVCCCLLTLPALAQPIAPSMDPLKPSLTPTDPNAKKTPLQIPDLPYKPQNLPIDSQLPQNDNENGDDTGNIAKGLDWSKVPFIPSKSPSFKPAPDPAFD
jgi:hypothetical protein